VFITSASRPSKAQRTIAPTRVLALSSRQCRLPSSPNTTMLNYRWRRLRGQPPRPHRHRRALDHAHPTALTASARGARPRRTMAHRVATETDACGRDAPALRAYRSIADRSAGGSLVITGPRCIFVADIVGLPCQHDIVEIVDRPLRSAASGSRSDMPRSESRYSMRTGALGYTVRITTHRARAREDSWSTSSGRCPRWCAADR